MIAQVKAKTGSQGNEINLQEFTTIMLPKMQEDVLNHEDNLEDLRAMFLEADVDQSGSLTIDEMYSVVLKMGADIS
jgi:Ca2+-binding EF-hand superfamily protein